MTRMMKLMMGAMTVALMTGGSLVHAAGCFNDDVQLELIKITSDTQQTLNQSLSQQVSESKLKEFVRGQFYLVSQLAAMCGGQNTADGQAILNQGNAQIRALLVNYDQALQNANGQFGEAKIWRIGVERTGGGD